MNPSLRNLFMKRLTRDLVVPTISASVSWLIFAMIGSGFASLPKFAIRRSSLARRFSLELKGAVAELVGIEGGVVSGVINLESSGVEASDWRRRHDEHYHEV